MRISLLYLVGLILYTNISLGQSTNISGVFQSNFKKAERMYVQQAYRNAIDLYRLAIDSDPGNRVAKARVADCYYRMGKLDDANRWYLQLLKQGEPSADEYYRLAQVQCARERYDSARASFVKAAELDSTQRRARAKIVFIDNMSAYRKDPASYAMDRKWYNSPQSDFSPRHFKEGIVFVSSRDRDLFIKRKSLSGISESEGLLNAFYVGSNFDSAYSTEHQISLFYSKALNSPYHDGPVTFYAGGKKIAFTRNIIQNGKPAKDEFGRVNLELYFATLGENRHLENLERYSFSDRSYSIAHPWVSEDGKTLYFSSNMPGGKGGADLYVSHFNENAWTKPQNLGDGVNTPGDEFTPYQWNDQLFFSSDGFGGFGGLDNYVAQYRDNAFQVPENLGYPLNSSRDDFGLIIDGAGREGYFASNRLDGNDDVYKFFLKKVTLIGHLKELQSNNPVPLATITIAAEDNLKPLELTTDDHGNFMAELDVDKGYRITPSKEGYTALSDQRLTTKSPSIVADTLAISIWKNGLFAKGIVYSNELQRILPGTMVYLNNLSTGKIDSVLTSAEATYNFLVLPNMTYKVTARYAGYLENGFNLNTKGLFYGDLINDILLEETYQEKLTVLFDYDKWDLRPEFIKDMNKIIRSLRRYKKATVYIGAHADAQGTREYNKKLSDKRAATIVAFLKSKNIDTGRIQAFGFGEELILNLCSDGVECSDEEHSKNRRVEIKVQLDGSK